MVETVRNLGLAYYSLGQVERAIEFHTQALAIACEIGDRRGEGIEDIDCWNLGLLFEESGPERAATLMSVTVCRADADRAGGELRAYKLLDTCLRWTFGNLNLT